MRRDKKKCFVGRSLCVADIIHNLVQADRTTGAKLKKNFFCSENWTNFF